MLAEAQHVSVPRLLVECALAVTPGQTVTDRRDAIAELFALHRLLTSIANNVNQLARAVNSTAEVSSLDQTLAMTLPPVLWVSRGLLR